MNILLVMNSHRIRAKGDFNAFPSFNVPQNIVFLYNYTSSHTHFPQFSKEENKTIQ